MMLRMVLLVLSGFAATSLLSGCNSDEDALKTVIESYNQAESHTIELNTQNQSSGVTATLLGKFDGNREYVQLGSDEYYREIREEDIIIYGKRQDGGWGHEVVPNTSSDDDSFPDFSAHVSQGQLSHEWFTHSNDQYYDLEQNHYQTLFKDEIYQSVTEGRLRITDEGFEIFYTLHTKGGAIDHLVKFAGFDTTTVELPEVA